jgi:hypothetical protein
VHEATEKADSVSDDAVPAADAELAARLNLVYESEPSALGLGLRIVLRRTFERNSW